MDNLAKALGERIRAQRKICRMSQDALALACSIDRSYMGRIERGEVSITVEKLYRIASMLSCNPASLLPASRSWSSRKPTPGQLRTVPLPSRQAAPHRRSDNDVTGDAPQCARPQAASSRETNRPKTLGFE